jgi:hypothetical protein
MPKWKEFIKTCRKDGKTRPTPKPTISIPSRVALIIFNDAIAPSMDIDPAFHDINVRFKVRFSAIHKNWLVLDFLTTDRH